MNVLGSLGRGTFNSNHSGTLGSIIPGNNSYANISYPNFRPPQSQSLSAFQNEPGVSTEENQILNNTREFNFIQPDLTNETETTETTLAENTIEDVQPLATVGEITEGLSAVSEALSTAAGPIGAGLAANALVGNVTSQLYNSHYVTAEQSANAGLNNLHFVGASNAVSQAQMQNASLTSQVTSDNSIGSLFGPIGTAISNAVSPSTSDLVSAQDFASQENDSV